MTNVLRFLSMMGIAMFVTVGQASACSTIDHHRTVFFSGIVDDVPVENFEPNKFFGVVELRLKRKWYFARHDKSEGFDAKVLESPTHPEWVGKTVEVPLMLETSCGPTMDAGNKGYIFGTVSTQGTKHTVSFLRSFSLGISSLSDQFSDYR